VSESIVAAVVRPEVADVEPVVVASLVDTAVVDAEVVDPAPVAEPSSSPPQVAATTTTRPKTDERTRLCIV
jgi:hypothetical protein